MRSKLEMGGLQFHLRYLAIFLLLVVLAGLLRYWIAPLAGRLPHDYASEIRLSVKDRIRDTPTAEYTTSSLTNRRMDQTLINLGNVSIIQGDLHVNTDSGVVVFESTGMYGVDRYTRLNMDGYGDVMRSGQYLFPPHVLPSAYQVWDPMFIGPRYAVYDHSEMLEQLLVYVFYFSAAGLDETAGYSYLADVPESYLAYTDGSGVAWVEPVSGRVVDYQEQGLSYFVEPATGKRVADFHDWTGQFTSQTKAEQINLASAERLRALLLENALPGGLFLLGLLVLGFGLWSDWRPKTQKVLEIQP